MKQWILVLSGVLAVQLILAIALNLSEDDHGTFRAEEALLTIAWQELSVVRIDEGDTSVKLEKRDGHWVLPERDNFPASDSGVEQFLAKLKALKKGWPVATTPEAAKRFKVTDDSYEKKLTFFTGKEEAAHLFVGTSPGFRKVHVSTTDDQAVYAAELNAWEVTSKSDDWLDKEMLKLPLDQLEHVATAGFELQQTDGRWSLIGLPASEETLSDQARAWVEKLANLRFDGLLGRELKPEYQQQPALEIDVALPDGKSLHYRFSKPADETDYVLKRSDSDYYFKVSPAVVKPLLDMSRQKLIKVKAEPETTQDSAQPADE